MYKSEVFLKKQIKQVIHKRINEMMLSYNDKGSIFSLPGPLIEAHYNYFKPILRKKSELVFAEIDENAVIEGELIKKIKNLNDKRVRFYQGDIWDAIIERINSVGWKHKHVLFDLDFCQTADTLIKNGLYDKLDMLARSKLPRRQGFWLTITFCRRKGSKIWSSAISKIIQIFMNYSWYMSISMALAYREPVRVSAPMTLLVFRFRKHSITSGRRKK